MVAPTPHKLKVISGTVQPCRENTDALEVEPITEIPDPPNWFSNPFAIIEFQRLAPYMVRYKLLTPLNIGAFATLCDLYGRYVENSLAGRQTDAATLGQMRGYWVEFGLTPLSQGKLKNPDAGNSTPKNKFNGNGKRA